MIDRNAFYSLSALVLLATLCIELSAQDMDQISFIDNPDEQEIKVMVGENHLTSYLYKDDIEKPVLYPIYSLKGKLITRGYPYIPVEGERVDHPHHLGFWLNYGDVNGYDFWNNSSAIPAEKKDKYGEVRHKKVLKMQDGKGVATLTTASEWQSPDEVLLDDVTTLPSTSRATC